MATCQQEKKAPATIQRNIGVMRRAIKHYERKGNKVPSLEWPKFRVVSRQRHLTLLEQGALLSHASKAPTPYCLITLFLHTGMPLGEAERLGQRQEIAANWSRL